MLFLGGVRSATGLLGKRSPDVFQMKTENATISIRGTNFGALLCNSDRGNIPTISGRPPDNGLHTDTASGKTLISNAAGACRIIQLYSQPHHGSQAGTSDLYKLYSINQPSKKLSDSASPPY
jgi:hypothetical protein